MTTLIERLERTVRDVPDFPKPGILFKDITPVLADGALYQELIDALAARYADAPPDMIVGIESRGFIFGCPVASKLGVGFAPVRKPNKLPAAKIGVSYELEYGTDRLELHADAIKPGQRVVIVDDLLATGGTASAAAALVRQLGGVVVECVFMIELSFLPGRARLGDVPVHAVLSY
jgi:adenine phosphoribosyltransferase